MQPAVVDARAIFTAIEPSLVACFQTGLRTTPEMTDAKVTLDASFADSGAASCAVPREDVGFTQDVADCFAEALGKTSLAGAPRSVTLPIIARAGALSLGAPRADAAVIESVETVRMPDAFEMLDTLESPLAACVHGKGATAKSMIVAARVSADGRAECTLAASAGPLPPAVASCAASVLQSARFPAPKRGAGIVVIPLLLGR